MRVYRVAISLLAVVCAGQVWADPVVISGGDGVMGGKGVSICAFPDVCKTPVTPALPGIPIPYPNIGVSSDSGTKRSKPQYEYTNVGEPWDSLARRLRAEDERVDAGRELDEANKEYRYWSYERDLVEDFRRREGQGGDPWTDEVHAEHNGARTRRDEAQERYDDAAAEEGEATEANEQTVAEFEHWQSQQPKKEYEPYEGKPRYVELPEPETDSPPPLTPAEIDRAFESLDRDEYYRVLNAHADGKATIEEVEEAYARLPRYSR